MIFFNSFGHYVVLGILLFHHVSASAYEININGQTFQVNVVSQGGEQYHDRLDFTDDFGDALDTQPDAICSSLRGEQCLQVTNNGDKVPNLFNYFPSHKAESIIAQSNAKYNTNKSPYELRQPMDDRILQVLSRQNPYYLGTKPLKSIKQRRNLAQQLFNDNININDPLKLVKSKKIKRKKKIKNNNNNNNKINNEKNGNNNENNDGNKDEEYEDVEVELYSNLDGDTELADALGMDAEELGDTVDRIVSQLVASYLDNDSEEVDVGQIFANEMSVENGDVSMDQINLDEGSMQEMSDLLNNIAKKYKKKKGSENGNSDSDNGNVDSEQAQVFALKFVVDSDDNANTNSDDGGSVAQEGNDNVEKIDNNQNKNEIDKE